MTDRGALSERILEQLSSAVVLLDHKLCIAYLNPAAESLLAISQSRAPLHPISEFFPHDERAAQHAALEQALAQGSSFTQREACLHSNQHRHSVDYSVTPFGQGLLLELHPLDRLHQIAREEARQSGQQASRALLRGLAHEIKNPLGGIRGAAQLLARAEAADELDEFSRLIIGEVDRLTRLTDRLLGSRQRPKVQAVNVHQYLEQARQLSQAQYPGISLIKDYDPSLPELNIDPEQLMQVLLNLIGNACQILTEHPPTQGAQVVLRSRHLRQFTLGSQRHRLVLRIDIQDNGPGIDPALSQTLFYPLVSGRADGTGLGLSIAQEIAQHYQGLIEYRSEPGHTCFSLLLPYRQMEASHAGRNLMDH